MEIVLRLIRHMSIYLVYLAITSKSCLGMGLQVHICIPSMHIGYNKVVDGESTLRFKGG